MLGSLLKQMIGKVEVVSQEIYRAFQEHQETLGGRKPQLGNIMNMLQAITSSRRTFISIDALDECTAQDRFKLLDALKQILEKSPHTRIFVTGRPHIRAEIERRLAGQVASVSISPTGGDIIRFLRVRLVQDETPDAMDEDLEADILEKIPQNTSEMCVRASIVKISPRIIR